jgi:aromatic-L-amino-acid decarboxylase
MSKKLQFQGENSPSDGPEGGDHLLADGLGDMDPQAFREAALTLVDGIGRYLGGRDDYPVLAQVGPGDIRAALPARAPELGVPMREILSDFERTLVPGLTHWNHPAFFAYFATSGSGPGVLAEFLTAALNQQAMLWRTSPAATELEEVVLGWLRELLGLPPVFEGVIYDGGSASNLHALVAAREVAVAGVRTRGLAARHDVPALRVYCSEHAHLSVDKAVILLGLGHQALRKVPVDDEYRMQPRALEAAVREDEAAGALPVAVVATVGTTSTSSVDPVPAIADVCEARRLWLHVDASYAGPAAMLPERAWIFDGVSRADSLVVNPHKWLFTPIDLSAFYCRRLDVLRAALALTPDYLETRESGTVQNLMDTGVALGRRFRALKLWMVLRYFGAAGLRSRLAEHIRLAQLFSEWIDADSDFERLAPVPLSVVCFRAAPRGFAEQTLDRLNAELLERVNALGKVFLSHTRLRGRLALRLAVGHIRTSESHIALAWRALRSALSRTLEEGFDQTSTCGARE